MAAGNGHEADELSFSTSIHTNEIRLSFVEEDIDSISLMQFCFVLGNMNPAVGFEEWLDLSWAVVVYERDV